MSEIKYGVSKDKVLFSCTDLSDVTVCKMLVAEVKTVLAAQTPKSISTLVLDLSGCATFSEVCVSHLKELAKVCKGYGVQPCNMRASTELENFMIEHDLDNDLPDFSYLNLEKKILAGDSA